MSNVIPERKLHQYIPTLTTIADANIYRLLLQVTLNYALFYHDGKSRMALNCYEVEWCNNKSLTLANSQMHYQQWMYLLLQDIKCTNSLAPFIPLYVERFKVRESRYLIFGVNSSIDLLNFWKYKLHIWKLHKKYYKCNS